MSSRAVHDAVGVGAGALLACWQAGDQSKEHVALEGAGGAIFGFLGSRIPDLIDPPALSSATSSTASTRSGPWLRGR